MCLDRSRDRLTLEVELFLITEALFQPQILIKSRKFYRIMNKNFALAFVKKENKESETSSCLSIYQICLFSLFGQSIVLWSIVFVISTGWTTRRGTLE